MIGYYPTPVEWCSLAYEAMDLDGCSICMDYYAGDGVMGRTMKRDGYAGQAWATEIDPHFKEMLSDLDYFFIGDVLIDDTRYDRVVLNPPFSLWSQAFAHARAASDDVIIFAPSTYLEGQDRYRDFWSKGGVTDIVQFARRLRGFGGFDNKGRVFIRWRKGYRGKPKLHWVNPTKGE